MAKKRNHSRKNSFTKKKKAEDRHFLPPFVQGYIFGLVFLLLAAIVLLSFFELAGKGGQGILEALLFLLGRSAFVLPVFLVLAGAVFFVGGRNHQKIWKMTVLAFFSCLIGLSAVLNSFDGVSFSLKQKALGGLVGYFLSLPFLRIFGFWVNLVIFGGLIIFGFFIFWQVAKKIKPQTAEELAEQPPVLKKIFEPRFKIKEIKDSRSTRNTGKELALPPELKTKPIFQGVKSSVYKKPSLDFLEVDRGEPTTGDIRNNMAIIKNTLETFSIPVEMGEVNIGPTVTRYTLKPAEGIKLSKITALSNDLSLALATHPIRIEAPIPGKSLVGIEVPNKVRTQVRLRNIFETPEFQDSPSPLLFSLGRDVAGNICFADLTRMPHLLVAGSTGTGKTICLNNIILSLLYRNSPETLRLIMIDPKRVEFPVYQEIPHLLSPVIFDSQKTVNVFKWLTKEMERRFEVLASAKARDIASYNREANFRLSKAAVKGQEEDLEAIPYIVVIVDELADLMAARGKEIEGGIVRLAQMARAVGIHLVVATQRPSVEVVTGLIKANITSRITFQVASQVDSRTVMDSAGAEKLLGAGDMLFISSETARPRRIQGAYVTDKEVKKVTDFLKSQREEFGPLKENFLAEELEKELEIHPPGSGEFYSGDEDPLYLQAKQLVIEFRKASASLLQRRLRVGYARAARLLDILENRGVVGPADGAKPREVYIAREMPGQNIEIKVKSEDKEDSDDGDNDWEKV